MLTNRKTKPTTRKKRSVAKRRASASKKSKKRSFFSLFSAPLWVYCLGGIFGLVLCLASFYFFFVSPISFQWRATLSEPVYPEGYPIRGIDVSHYQSEIAWEQVRNASINNDPVHFVFIKATEGLTLSDKNFNHNFFQAKRNGLIRGAYHFFIPQYSAEKQAQFFIRQVQLEAGDLPPVLDVETVGGVGDKELRRAVHTWLRLVEAHYGVKPIIYASYKFKERYLNDKIFDDYPFWIAHYQVKELAYKGVWHFWQHTDRGSIVGIKGDVDINVFNGSYTELKALTIQPEVWND